MSTVIHAWYAGHARVVCKVHAQPARPVEISPACARSHNYPQQRASYGSCQSLSSSHLYYAYLSLSQRFACLLCRGMREPYAMCMQTLHAHLGSAPPVPAATNIKQTRLQQLSISLASTCVYTHLLLPHCLACLLCRVCENRMPCTWRPYMHTWDQHRRCQQPP